MQLVIPKFDGNSDSWSLSYSTSGVLDLPAFSKYRQRGGSLLRSSRLIVCYTILLLMIGLLKGTGAFWESPGSCVFDYSSCSNCPNFLIAPTGTGALGKLKIHAWEMLSTHRSYYNYYSYSERGRCLLLSSRIMFFHVFTDSTSDNFSIYFCHSQRDKCLWGVPDSCFSISSFLKLGNFRLIVSLILLLQIFSVFGSARIISIPPNGTGPF